MIGLNLNSHDEMNSGESAATALSAEPPQFGVAHFVDQPRPDICGFCHQPIGGNYFRVNDLMTCASCASRVQENLPRAGKAALARGILFGCGGALLGMALYSLFVILTHIQLALMSIAVGYIVAHSIKMGSKGRGGRPYQIAAIVLTYAAVSVSAVPIGISFYSQQQARKAAVAQNATPAEQAASAAPSSAPEKKHMSIPYLLVMLVGWGLFSPFLALQQPVNGLIGLVILAVGMQIAWRNSAGLPILIDGPFSSTPNPIPPHPTREAGN